MRFFYDLGVRLYIIVLKLIAPFNQKADLMLSGRKAVFEQLEAFRQSNKSPVAWFHCASVGEFEQGRPLMEAFKEAFPHYSIALTFFSPSGYELRKNYEGADIVTYLPFDTATNARRLTVILDPQFAFFIKYEFWHHYLSQLKNRGVWTFSVSTIFRASQPFFRWYGGHYRKILDCFDHFFVQNKSSAVLLQTINKHNYTIAGDSRYDRVVAIAAAVKKFPLIEQFVTGSQVFVAGSTWPRDIAVLKTLIHSKPKLKFIIAPHEISEKYMTEIESAGSSIRYSRAEKIDLQPYQIMIIDNVGMLASLYQYGHLAWIGGAYGAGLHNTLEAAAFGLPVFFGNRNYQKFDEAIQLLRIGAAQSIANGEMLKAAALRLLDDNELLLKKQTQIRAFVQKNSGATDKILAYCKRIIIKHES